MSNSLLEQAFGQSYNDLIDNADRMARVEFHNASKILIYKVSNALNISLQGQIGLQGIAMENRNDMMQLDAPYDSQWSPIIVEGRKELLDGFDAAFEFPPHGQALHAFMEFLDFWWGEMVSGFKLPRGSANSYCGSIVQSSCTGKSRLVEM